MAKEIKLSKGKVAIVDEEDYARLSKYKWSASFESRGTKWYAVRCETKRVIVELANGTVWTCTCKVKIRMHRFIMGLPPGKFDDRVVDHKNDNPLDNRRENLEIVTQEENMKRSSGWKKKGQTYK